jgi:hypothetical protein
MWNEIFIQDQQGERQLNIIHRLVSAVLSIPGSNAFVERIFSLSGVQWTDERNSLKVETIKAILQTIVNFDLSCVEMHKYLSSNPKLLKEILGNEKY